MVRGRLLASIVSLISLNLVHTNKSRLKVNTDSLNPSLMIHTCAYLSSYLGKLLAGILRNSMQYQKHLTMHMYGSVVLVNHN